MALLNAVDVPCGPIMSTKDLIDDKSMADRGMIVTLPHKTRGTFKTVGCPIRLSDSPVEYATSPLLGEHTEEVLTTLLKFSKEDVKKMKSQGAI